jgi:hypothetical protein
LTNFEKQIAKTTDRLAGLLTAKVVQEALDSDDLKQQSSELIKSMPGKMENQGLREVKIKPLRGGAFTVKTAYYTKKKKGKRKKKNSKQRSLPWAFHFGHIRSFYTWFGRASMFDCHDRRLVSKSRSGTARSRYTY